MRSVSVELEYWFDKCPERVFTAWTDPNIAKNWIPGSSDAEVVTASVNLKEGGEYRYVMKVEDYGELALHGVYREVEPASGLTYSLSWDDVADLNSPPETGVNLTFYDQDGRTRLRIVHEGLVEGMEASIKEGWLEACDRLAEWLRASATI